MTVHFKMLGGGRLRAGRIEGEGEIYTENAETGDGTVYKGNFVKGLLTDETGVKIVFNNNIITEYKCAFTQNKMNGTVEILTYTESDNSVGLDLIPNGNGIDGENGIKHISNSNLDYVVGNKIIRTYTDDVAGADISNVPANISIDLTQKIYGGSYNIFTNIELTEYMGL